MSYEALYLHIPFCRSKCAYCDFDSRAFGACSLDVAIDTYLESLVAQLDTHGRAGDLRDIRTVYVGGGTPSLLGARLVHLVERVRTWCAPVEFTCEANPESFTPELAEGLRRAGVTRISLGVQSLNTAELAVLGRIHSADEACAAVSLAKSAGFSTSADLMCGLPGQTLESWRTTLTRLLELNPDHVSVYPLQLEEGTLLAVREEVGEIAVPDEDFQAACMDLAADLLSAHGYTRYEVASYAKPGHRCQHNIAYWTGKAYLGLGRSAASMRPQRVDEAGDHAVPGRVRTKQLDDAGTEFDREVLTAREACAEDLMLACRMTDGIPVALLERATVHVPHDEVLGACEEAVAKGLAAWHEGNLVPTHLGWLEGNELFSLFWDLSA